MTGIALLAGRWLAGCAGVLLIYSSLFLYKEEEGGLQNIVERWWQRIRNLHAGAVSRQTAFFKIVADITSKGFTKVFGKRLFGPKAIAASICYSLSAILLFISTILELKMESPVPKGEWVMIVTTGAFSLFFLVLGSLGPFIERRWLKLSWMFCVLVAAVGFMPVIQHVGMVADWGPSNGLAGSAWYSMMLYGLPLAVICDFLFITLTRQMLSTASQSNSFIKIAAFAIGNAALALFLVVLPAYLGRRLHNGLAWDVGVSTSASNLFDALVSTIWVLVAALMLLHRVIWPLIERPIYALYRYDIFAQQKKLVFFSGVTLLGIGIPAVGRALENVIRAIHA